MLSLSEDDTLLFEWRLARGVAKLEWLLRVPIELWLRDEFADALGVWKRSSHCCCIIGTWLQYMFFGRKQKQYLIFERLTVQRVAGFIDGFQKGSMVSPSSSHYCLQPFQTLSTPDTVNSNFNFQVEFSSADNQKHLLGTMQEKHTPSLLSFSPSSSASSWASSVSVSMLCSILNEYTQYWSWGMDLTLYLFEDYQPTNVLLY